MCVFFSNFLSTKKEIWKTKQQQQQQSFDFLELPFYITQKLFWNTSFYTLED